VGSDNFNVETGSAEETSSGGAIHVGHPWIQGRGLCPRMAGGGVREIWGRGSSGNVWSGGCRGWAEPCTTHGVDAYTILLRVVEIFNFYSTKKVVVHESTVLGKRDDVLSVAGIGGGTTAGQGWHYSR
jgi:hypothetical protein